VGPVLFDILRPELEEVAEGVRFDDACFSRLDPVTDLRCDPRDMSGVLWALEAVPSRRGPTRQILRSTLERPETLWVKNKAGGMRLYDNLLDKYLKGDLSKKGAEGSMLRAEGEDRRDWLKAAGCREMRDVLAFPENVVLMHKKRIEWAGFDREVSALSTWVDELARFSEVNDISDRKRYAVMGYLLDVAHGRSPSVSRATAFRYRAIAKQCGVQPEDLRQPARVEVGYRLDFEKGEVVRRVA
jgi:hypothetical protein